jgi:molecular chaperone GrpE
MEEVVAENHEVGQGLDDGSEGASSAPEAEEQQAEEVSSGAMDDLFLSPDDSDGEEVPGETESASPEEAPQPEGAQSAESAAEVQQLQDKVDELTTERDEAKNRMMRVAADLENFRKRAHREKDELRRYGIDKVVLELLPVLDNLERALEHSQSADAGTIVDGVRMVHRQFVGALRKHGVEGFESKGEKFDPQKHEAIQQLESAEHETGTILEQYQKGYYLHDRLIRPALVVVARRVEAAPADEEQVEGPADEEVTSLDAETRAVEDEPDAPEDDEQQEESAE